MTYTVETPSQRVGQAASSSVGRNHSGDSVGEAALMELTLEPVTRTEPQPNEPARGKASPSSGERRLAVRSILACLKGLATLAIALFAILMALVTWDYYVTAPWTQDGRVRVQVASVAPQISGRITEQRVGDNQYVHKGDVLYVIDPFDFEVALQEDRAQLQQNVRRQMI
jgi:hypothetical protein